MNQFINYCRKNIFWISHFQHLGARAPRTCALRRARVRVRAITSLRESKTFAWEDPEDEWCTLSSFNTFNKSPQLTTNMCFVFCGEKVKIQRVILKRRFFWGGKWREISRFEKKTKCYASSFHHWIVVKAKNWTLNPQSRIMHLSFIERIIIFSKAFSCCSKILS